jgi:hypothetical protein
MENVVSHANELRTKRLLFLVRSDTVPGEQMEDMMKRLAYIRDFVAITGFFGTMYAWFVVGALI